MRAIGMAIGITIPQGGILVHRRIISNIIVTQCHDIQCTTVNTKTLKGSSCVRQLKLVRISTWRCYSLSKRQIPIFRSHSISAYHIFIQATLLLCRSAVIFLNSKTTACNFSLLRGFSAFLRFYKMLQMLTSS